MSGSSALAFALALLLVPAAPGAAAESYIGLHTRSNSNVLEQSYAFSGISVTQVVENSPAAAAGLREGDILLRANGIELSHPDRLADLLEKLPPGSRIRLRIERARRVLERELTSVARVEPPAEEPAASVAAGSASSELRIERRLLGIEFAPAAPERLRALGIAERGGVELTALASRSPLLQVGLRPGDLVLEVSGERIPSPDALLEYLEQEPAPRELELLAIDTAGERRELSVSTYRPPFAVTRFSLCPLFDIERGADANRYSFGLGALLIERRRASASYRLLWLVQLRTGSTDTLEPVRD